MNKLMIVTHNVQTNEIIEREMNADELAQYQVDQIETKARQQAEATKAASKAALLNRLGITEDEAKLLLA
jgi:predicted metal-dependent HD superfamily phosphohydrolase